MFYESNTKGTNFRIKFICFTFVKCAYFVLYSTCVRFDLVKSPEVTLCGSRGYKPSINNNNNNNNTQKIYDQLWRLRFKQRWRILLLIAIRNTKELWHVFSYGVHQWRILSSRCFRLWDNNAPLKNVKERATSDCTSLIYVSRYQCTWITFTTALLCMTFVVDWELNFRYI